MKSDVGGQRVGGKKCISAPCMCNVNIYIFVYMYVHCTYMYSNKWSLFPIHVNYDQWRVPKCVFDSHRVHDKRADLKALSPLKTFFSNNVGATVNCPRSDRLPVGSQTLYKQCVRVETFFNILFNLLHTYISTYKAVWT